MRLDNASAIVSGGAGGLGEATVRRLVRAGMSVIVADLDEERGEALAKELGPAALFVPTDVTSDESHSFLLQVGRPERMRDYS